MKNLFISTLLILLVNCNFDQDNQKSNPEPVNNTSSIQNNNQIVLEKAAMFIKKYEGFSAKTYPCSANKPTIGFGTRSTSDNEQITVAIATERLLEHIRYLLYKIEDTHFKEQPLNINQKVALISFIFNTGETTFVKSRLFNLLKNNSTQKEVEASWIRYNKATVDGSFIELAGLTIRRKEEVKLFYK